MTVGGVLVQGPAPVPASSSSDATTQPVKTKIIPGFIYGTTENVETKVKGIAIFKLGTRTWNEFHNSTERDNIIKMKHFVYIKIDEAGKVHEIGIHIAKCQQIQEEGRETIAFEEYILPKDTLVRAIPESSYQNMIKKFLPLLA